MKTTMKKKSSRQPICCAIYARTATVKKPREDNSITQQVAKCKRFAKERGWTVGEDCIFIDSGMSGLRVNSGLQNLMRTAALKPKRFGVVLCTSIDRIARDTGVLTLIYGTLKNYGVKIRFAVFGGAALSDTVWLTLSRLMQPRLRTGGNKVRDVL